MATKAKIIKVKWHDAAGVDDKSWLSDRDIEGILNDPVVITTVGYYHSETKEFLAVVSSFGHNNEENMYAQMMMIPKSTIIERKEIKSV